jgi:hypothetical protein
MLSRRASSVLAVTASVAGLALSAHAAVQVLHTKIPTSPTSLVPGAKDLAGNPVVTNFRAMELLRVSPDGNHWVMKSRNQLGSDLETQLVYGTGNTRIMLAQEGQPIPGGAAGELYDFMGSIVGRFNENNEFAYSARARGGLASVFQKVIRWDSVNGYTLRFQMGDLISGCVDNGGANPAGDELVGNSVGAIHLLNDGRIGAHDTSVTQIFSSFRPVLMYKAAGAGNAGSIDAFKQRTAWTLASLGGFGNLAVTGISDTFLTTPDGAHWGVTGTYNNGLDALNFFVFDNIVRLQTGELIPGSSGLIANTFIGFEVTPDGSWHVRGGTAAITTPVAIPVLGYAIRDGVTIATAGGGPVAGSPITPGNAEQWFGTAFTAFNGNNAGDYVLAGKTNNANAAIDDVIVVNGNRVILREGDPIDVDGNGLFDDNAFVGRGVNTNTSFVGDTIFITANREVYAVINLRDGAGVDLNSSPSFGTPNALVKITWCQADLDDDGNGGNGGLPDGGVDINDLLFFLSAFEAGSAAADLDNDGDPAQGTPDGGVDINDLLFFLARFEAGC